MASLRSRIRGGESATVEYKIEAPEPDRLARTIAAFANSAGGAIFIGISDRGDIHGVQDPEAQKKLVEDALWYVDPPVRPKVETIVHEFKDVVAVEVPLNEYPDLVWIESEPDPLLYFRVGAETRPLDRTSEKEVIRLRRHARGRRDLDANGRELLSILWKDGPKFEPACAKVLNFSTNRVRKLLEDLIGAGFVIAYDIGRQRTYAAIHPGPDPKAR